MDRKKWRGGRGNPSVIKIDIEKTREEENSIRFDFQAGDVSVSLLVAIRRVSIVIKTWTSKRIRI